MGSGYGAQVRGAGTYLAESPLLGRKYAGETGVVYKADLPDQMISRMLNWDAPLAQQPEILNTIRSAIPKKLLNYFDYHTEKGLTGEQFYSQAKNYFGKKTDFELSKYLQSLGIPGTVYLNKGAHGTGTRNFVVFPGEEKKVRILERE